MVKLRFNEFYWLPLVTKLVSDVVQTWTQIYLQVMTFSSFSIKLQTQPNSEKIVIRIKKRKLFSKWDLIYPSWINNANKRLINILISTLDMEVILILDLLYKLPFNKTRAYQKTSLQTSGLWRSYYTSSHSLYSNLTLTSTILAFNLSDIILASLNI